MEKANAVAILAALAQDNRLDVFRLLVEAGPEGMPAGHIAASLRMSPNALTFHLDRLREVELVAVRRDGRNMIYSAQYAAMNGLIDYLTAHCCGGRPEACAPKPAAARRKTERVR